MANTSLHFGHNYVPLCTSRIGANDYTVPPAIDAGLDV